MLIEFSVANFKSLRDRQTLSLVKAKGNELEEFNTFNVSAYTDFNLLRSAAIYGPNASGKSNFIFALAVMKNIIDNSAKELGHDDDLPVKPFLLNRKNIKAPCEFEVTFIIDHVRYQYGFSATDKQIYEEWLLAYPKGRPQTWFARNWSNEESNYVWQSSSSLKGEKQLWQKSTRKNALFLSTAVQLNSEQLRPIYDWFNKSLRIANYSGWGPGYSASLCKTERKENVMDFLHAADLNISDVLVEEAPFDAAELPEGMPRSVREAIVNEMEGKQILDIKTAHKTQNGDSVFFDFEEESMGTQKLFSFAGPWLDSLTNGYVLFIDELHNSLHPLLVKFLIELFHNEDSNPNNAQLVFTTHETSILNQDKFRRDQIWFCEKDNDQASVLYPLSDFSPRKGRENLELAYLSGRYGALPITRTLEAIVDGDR